MFEGFIQSIDTHLQLYAITTDGTYNQRAVSSLVNETFFAELSDLEPTKLGCPKANLIPRLMSTVTELLHYRHVPESRSFHMRTSHNPVYPVHEVDDHALHVDSPERVNEPSKIPRVITDIVIKDHFFDTKERCRTKRRKAKSNEVSKPKDIARGVHGVRQHFSPAC